MDLRNTYTGTSYPEVVTEKVGRTTYMYIPYDITEENGAYSWKYVLLPSSKYGYDYLIDAIIGMKYELKKSLAIVNNYLLDSSNEEYKKEFDDFQKWRLFAKTEAKKHFNL